MAKICPNLSDPKVKAEFDNLINLVGENLAYTIWKKNNGNPLSKAPNGEESRLYEKILELPQVNNNERLATKIKARLLSRSFENWYGEGKRDENGEPQLLYKLVEDDVEILEEGNTFVYTEYNKKQSAEEVILPVFSNGKEEVISPGSQVLSSTVKSLFNDGSYNQADRNIYYHVNTTVKDKVRQLLGLYGGYNVVTKELNQSELNYINHRLKKLSEQYGDVEWSLRLSKNGNYYPAGYKNKGILFDDYYSPYLTEYYNIDSAFLEGQKLQASKLFQTIDVENEANPEIPSEEIYEAAESLNQKLMNFVENNDILLRKTQEVTAKYKEQEQTPQITAKYIKEVVGNSKAVQHIIEVMEGLDVISNHLAEEVSHFAIDMIRDTPLYDMMKGRIKDFAFFKNVEQKYSDLYNHDATLIEEEAIAKLVSDLIIKKTIEERPGLENMAKRWWNRVWDWITRRFQNLTGSGEKGFNSMVEPFLETAEMIMKGQIITPGEGSFKYPNLVMAHMITDEVRVEKQNIIDELSTPKVEKVGNDFYDLDGVKVLNKVNDKVIAAKTSVLKSRDRTLDESSAEFLKNIYLKAWLNRIAAKFDEAVIDAKSVAEVLGKINMVTRSFGSHQVRQTLAHEVNTFSRGELLDQLGDIDSLEMIQTLPSKYVETLVKGMQNLYVHIYEKADLINKNSQGDFKTGDKPVIMTNVDILDEINNEVGTVDMIVVQPNGTIDKYMFQPHNFRVEQNTALNPFNALAKDGFDIQLMAYNDIMQNSGIDPKYFGESRVIPLHIKYSYKEDGSIAPGFSGMDMLTLDSDVPYLRHIPTQGEVHRDKKINQTIKKLFQSREKDLMARAKARKESEKALLDTSIARTEKILYELLVEDNLAVIYDEISTVAKKVKLAVNNSAEKASLQALNDTFEYLSNYDGILQNAEDELKRIKKKDKKRLKKVQNLLDDTRSLIIMETLERLREGSDIDLTQASPEIRAWAKQFAQIHEHTQPYMKRLYEMIELSQNSTLTDIQNLRNEIEKVHNSLSSWAKENGKSMSSAFELMYDHESGKLTDKFSEEYHQAFKDARRDKDEEWMKANTNMNDVSYFEDLEHARGKLEAILRASITSTLDESDIQRELDAFDNRFNHKVNSKALFYPNNKFIQLKDNPKNYSNKWRTIIKSGNEALLNYYNTYVKYNREFSKMLDMEKRNLDDRFIPNLRISLVEKMRKSNANMFEQGKSKIARSLKHLLETREFEPDSTYVDQTTKEQRRIIPVYFMDSVREYLTTKEIEVIKEEIKLNPNFPIGTEKFNIELRRRVNEAEVEKGKNYRSFDLSRSLVLFGESVYAHNHYSDQESLMAGLRNVIQSDKVQTQLYGQQGKLLKRKTKNIVATIEGVTGDDLKYFDKVVNTYFYKQQTQNKDKIFRKDYIDKETGQTFTTGRGMSTNKAIKTLMAWTAIKALGLNTFLATGNAINTISNIYIRAAGEIHYNRGDVKAARKALFRLASKKITGGDEIMAAFIQYIEPSARNINREKANNVSVHLLRKVLTMDNMFILHKKPDDFGDALIMGAMLHAYGLSPENKLVKKDKTEDGRSLFDRGKFDENGNFYIEGLPRTEKEFMKLRRIIQFEATQVKGSIPAEAKNMISSSVYTQALAQFKNWMKGIIQARFGQTQYSPVSTTLDGGRYKLALSQLWYGGNMFKEQGALRDRVKVLSRFTAEVLRTGAFGLGRTIFKRSAFNSPQHINKNALNHMYNKFLVDQGLTNKDVSLEKYQELMLAKMREMAQEVSILLTIYGLMTLLAALTGDDEDHHWATRAAYKMLERGALEMSFLVQPESGFRFVSGGLPVLGALEDTYKWGNATIDVVGDIFKDENNPNRAVFEKGHRDKTKLGHYTIKNFAPAHAVAQLFNYFDEPLQRKPNL